jgi:[ribosomal protein S5]-alanine N-acetyltransferase
MFIGTKIVVGSFVPEDYGAMFCWANDVVAARLDGAFRPTNLRDIVRLCEAAGQDTSRLMLAIRRRGDPKIIGYLHIHNISTVHRSADIGIRIGEEKHRGKGYGKEALAIALDYCWRHLNLERIGLIVFRHNARAIRAYKAVGFKKEGLQRKLLFIDGKRVDVVLMAAFRPSRRRNRPADSDVRVAGEAATATDMAASQAAAA